MEKNERKRRARLRKAEITRAYYAGLRDAYDSLVDRFDADILELQRQRAEEINTEKTKP